MLKSRGLCRIGAAAGAACLLAGCGWLIGHLTPVPGNGPKERPEPTAAQTTTGANPSPRIMNQFSVRIRGWGRGKSAGTYDWLQALDSKATREWIAAQNMASRPQLATIPRRVWLRKRLAHLRRSVHRAVPSGYVVTRVFYLGADGARMPMDIVHATDLAQDGNRPAVLALYRQINPLSPAIEPQVLAWVEMGAVYAQVDVLRSADAVAAAQYLIDHRYTRTAHLGLYGRGFDGLLVGKIVTEHPGLIAAAVSEAGLLLQVRPPAEATCYPPMLITTPEYNPSVAAWHSYRFAAELQAAQGCPQNPILVRVTKGTGFAEPATWHIERAAEEWGFLAKWLGMVVPKDAP